MNWTFVMFFLGIVLGFAWGSYVARHVEVIRTKKCVNCGERVRYDNGLMMDGKFVCTDCLHKTSYPVVEPDGEPLSHDGWKPQDEEDGWKEHAEAHYEQERQEFLNDPAHKGVPTDKLFKEDPAFQGNQQ